MTIDAHDRSTVDAFPVKRGRGRPRADNPKSAAQRMAESRARRRSEGQGARRLDCWLSSTAFDALDRLASRLPESSKADVLGALILEYESTAMHNPNGHKKLEVFL